MALLYGTVTAEHYEEAIAADPRIDELRSRTTVVENPQYSADYLDPERRSVTNAVQVHFQDRTSTSKVEVEYPLGHRRRRNECFPALEKKFMAALNTRMPPTRAGASLGDVRGSPEVRRDGGARLCGALLARARAPFLLPPMRGERTTASRGRGRRGVAGVRV